MKILYKQQLNKFSQLVVLVGLLISFTGCKSTLKFLFGTSTSEIMNSWIGQSKANLVMKWGPPNKIASDQNNGQIFLYSTQKHNQGLYNGYTNEWVGSYYYWEHKMFFINAENKIYHWTTRTDRIPPQEINLNIYFK